MLEKYGSLTAAQLRGLTHRESPWLVGTQSAFAYISDESMLDYYSHQTVERPGAAPLPGWSVVIVAEQDYASMMTEVEVPDDISGLVELVRRARAQLA